MSWNTYKRKKLPHNYEEWYKGGLLPIRLHGMQLQKTRASQHLGVLNTDDKIYPKALSVERIDG